MKLLKLAPLCVCLFAASALAEERLVYAVMHGARGGGTTEVFAVAPEDGKSTLLFSDKSSPVKLGFGPGFAAEPPDVAVAGNRLFAPGKERALNSGAVATAIFEFALDGSGMYRKIADLAGGERVDLLMVNDVATKLGYFSMSGKGTFTFFIHDIKTGALLHKLDMTDKVQAYIVRNAGWLPDNHTLFFTLEEGIDDEDSDPKQLGTWRMQDDGTSLNLLPQSFGKLEEPGYRSDRLPLMLDVINGKYLFDPNLYRPDKKMPSATFLALVDPQSGVSAEVKLPQTRLLRFHATKDGRYIAYKQREGPKFIEGRVIELPEHLFIQPVPGGSPKEILALEPDREPGLAVVPIGWVSE